MACGTSKLKACTHCKGSGDFEVIDVPETATVRAFSEVYFLASAAANHGTWPDPGGIPEQSEWFVGAVQWFNVMQAWHRDEVQKERERRARQRSNTPPRRGTR